MDPAQPAFELAGSAGRLDKGDATLVDVIHTNSGMLWEVNDTGFLTNIKQMFQTNVHICSVLIGNKWKLSVPS